MNTKILFQKTDKIRFVLCVALLGALPGCMGDSHQVRQGVYVARPPVADLVGVQDAYVYYPHHEVYYNSSRRQWHYLENGLWISRPTPQGVSIEALFASPSVIMEFHDSPAYHHSEMLRRFPRDWVPHAVIQEE